jgi:(4S)-4-hydroxy-5-phosphonooxypentane-2,3-dione isomerase
MIVVLVSLGIRPDSVETFAGAVRANAAASIFEPGCLRFEVYRDPADPTRFLLFEIYRDRAAREAHWQTAHFLDYRDATAELIETRTLTEYEPLDPSTPEDTVPEG